MFFSNKPMFLKSTIWSLVIFLFPTVIALVVIIFIPKIEERRQYIQVKEEMYLILDALKKFKSDINRYPTEEEGLLILKKNIGLQHWKGPYLKLDKFTDPWGSRYKYFLVNGKPFILSLGPNKKQENNLLEEKINKKKGDDIIEGIFEGI